MDDEPDQCAFFEIEGPDERGCVCLALEDNLTLNLGPSLQSLKSSAPGWRRSTRTRNFDPWAAATSPIPRTASIAQCAASRPTCTVTPARNASAG